MPIIFLAALLLFPAATTAIELEIRQITHGPQHHYFGYIGHVQNIPWSGDGRYIVALRVGFQDRMPSADDAADIILIDTQNNFEIRQIEQTRAWNPQQGTMLYWNPDAPDTQFFFNDRDPKTNHVFCVLFDIALNRRIREFRYPDTPFGNSGVAQKGGYFLGLNYARMARLRPVTGYPDTYDWTLGEKHPDNDGIFKVDIASGKKSLIVSFRQIRDTLLARHPEVDAKALFLNHTLSNRDNDRIYFYARGDFNNRAARLNVPMTVRPDGAELTEQQVFIGGHPEWEFGPRMFGAHDNRLVLYDTAQQKIVEPIGTPEIFPEPGGDTALSPDGKWIVNGADQGGSNYYVVYRRSDGAWARSRGFDRGEYFTGDLRIDAAPCWNRESNQFVFPALADDEARSRQMFVATIRPE